MLESCKPAMLGSHKYYLPPCLPGIIFMESSRSRPAEKHAPLSALQTLDGITITQGTKGGLLES